MTKTKDQSGWLLTDDREWNDLRIYKHRGSYFVELDDFKKEIAKAEERTFKKVSKISEDLYLRLLNKK